MGGVGGGRQGIVFCVYFPLAFFFIWLSFVSQLFQSYATEHVWLHKTELCDYFQLVVKHSTFLPSI